MESNPIGILILLPLFLIFFSAIWMIVLTIISLAGGWSKLAQTYPFSPLYTGKPLKTFNMCSVRLNLLATYSSSVKITLFEHGVLLKPMFLFSFMHKPIFLQWNLIEHIDKSKVLFSHRYKIHVAMKEIQLYGNAGEEVMAYYQYFLKQ